MSQSLSVTKSVTRRSTGIVLVSLRRAAAPWSLLCATLDFQLSTVSHPRTHSYPMVPSTQGVHPPSVPSHSRHCWRQRPRLSRHSKAPLAVHIGRHDSMPTLRHASGSQFHKAFPLPPHPRLFTYRPRRRTGRSCSNSTAAPGSQHRSLPVLRQNVGGRVARSDGQVTQVGVVCCEQVNPYLRQHLYLYIWGEVRKILASILIISLTSPKTGGVRLIRCIPQIMQHTSKS
jgi:hypothetical protein